MISIVLLFLTTCNNFASGSGRDSDPDGITYTDVVYSPDGKSVTIYLDGTTVPVTNRQSRALHKDLAIAGHDYFEVVFYNSAEPGKFVRAAWELRKEARIRNVTRGVDYDYVSTNVPGTSNPIPSGHGAAILFVGKKTDKTILGLGRLTQVDGANTTIIGTGAKTVTFSVAALDCGVKYTNVAGADPPTSFYTDANAPGPDSSPNQGDPIVPSDWNNVTIPPAVNNSVRVDSYPFSNSSLTFPMYKLVEGGVTHARYYFRTVGTTADNNLLSNFLDGIILAGSIEHGKKQPRFPIPGGGFQYFSVRQDEKTTIMAGNNTAAGVPFKNPVEVKFNTSGTIRGSVFAYVFEVPVYPLSSASDPGRWYIRASYDSNWWDLDNGKDDSKGGAVLMKTGEDETTSRLRIRVLVPPSKFTYSAGLGRNFNINDLVVVLEEDAPPHAFVDWLNPYTMLTYEIGSAQVLANTSYAQNNGDLLSSELAGMVEVIVYYREPGGIPYTDSFMIICDSGSSNTYTYIPDDHYVVTENANQFLNRVQNSGGGALPNTHGTYVIILTGSFDIANGWVINVERASSLFIFVAANPLGGEVGTGNPNVRIGRPNNVVVDLDPFILCQYTQTGFYFGKWPFNTNLVVGGIDYARRENVGYSYTILSSWEYAINANGPIAEITPASPAPAYDATSGAKPRPFLHYYQSSPGADGRMYRITLDEDVVTVVPRTGAQFK